MKLQVSISCVIGTEHTKTLNEYFIKLLKAKVSVWISKKHNYKLNDLILLAVYNIWHWRFSWHVQLFRKNKLDMHVIFGVYAIYYNVLFSLLLRAEFLENYSRSGTYRLRNSLKHNLNLLWCLLGTCLPSATSWRNTRATSTGPYKKKNKSVKHD